MSSQNEKDIAVQRHAKIQAMLRDRPVMRVNELCAKLGVSPASVRRDLAEMESRGLIKRVHGGAMSVAAGILDEPLFDDKTAYAAEQKERIAKAALALVQPTDTIFLDGGSTVLALAALLAPHARQTVVTNSLRLAGALSGSGPRIILTGGELRRVSQTFVGPLTRHLLDQVHIDTAFMGTIGLSSEQGLTTTDPREALTKEHVISRSRNVVLLADSTKLGAVSFVRFADITSVHTIITDSGAGAADIKPFRKLGITVIKA